MAKAIPALARVLGVTASLAIAALVFAAPAMGQTPSEAGPPGGSETDEIQYIWPVVGVVIDPFRPPEHAYGPGNRGLEFAVQEGSAFWAAAPGVVSFAGQVGGRLHVTVTHSDGLRVSYSGVATIGVKRGQQVRRSQRLGTTDDRLHVGVRRGNVYIDPAAVFGAPGSDNGSRLTLLRPRLVPASVSVYRLQLPWLHSGAGMAVL